MKLLKSQLSLILGGLLIIVLTVLNVITLVAYTEFPSGFIVKGAEALSVITQILPIVMVIVVAIFSALADPTMDAKRLSAENKTAVTITGITLIIYGAAQIIPFISMFSGSSPLFGIVSLLSSVSVIISGMYIFAKGAFHPAMCVSAIFVLVNLILKAMAYFVDNPLLKNSSQKYLYICFIILSSLFWLLFGRMLSRSDKKNTRHFFRAFGITGGGAGIAYCVSSFALMSSDSGAWMQLSESADIEIIVCTISLLVLSVVIPICTSEKV